MPLDTARLHLRRPVAVNAAAIISIAGDWEIARRLARVPYPYTDAEFAFSLRPRSAERTHLGDLVAPDQPTHRHGGLGSAPQTALNNERLLYQIVGMLSGEPRENIVAACLRAVAGRAGRSTLRKTPSSKICLPRAMSFSSPVLARDGACSA